MLGLRVYFLTPSLMAKQLYALQIDLDMVTQQISELRISHDKLDYIAKVVHDSELEQLCQAAQMRRMDDKFLDIQLKLNNFDGRLTNLEARMDKMERILMAICKKLEIDTTNL